MDCGIAPYAICVGRLDQGSSSAPGAIRPVLPKLTGFGEGDVVYHRTLSMNASSVFPPFLAADSCRR